MKIEEVPLMSMNAVRAIDRSGWLDLFEDDALIQDPVGGFAPLNMPPEGLRGKEQIGRFFDAVTHNQVDFKYEVHHLVSCGEEVVSYVTMAPVYKDGSSNPTKAVNIYKLSPAGKVASLRSFWKV